MFFERDLYTDLLAWQQGKYRKPLIVQGARQTGKTSLIRHFGKTQFANMAYFNFDERPELNQIFKQTKQVERLLHNLSIIHGRKIDATDTLIFFDEIQECEEALNALKYFSENAPEYAIIAAGSLLGISLGTHKSFPVGKVEFLKLYPLTFSEFLKAKNPRLAAYLNTINPFEPLLDAVFNECLDDFKTYMLCGGMPEPALRMVETMDMFEISKSLHQIHAAYALDFSKHAEKTEAIRINYVWDAIPSQLAKENKKFIYQTIRQGARAREYENALIWLEQAGLIYRVPLCKKPEFPLSFYSDLSAFKIYMLDIGLLRYQTKLDPLLFKEGNRLFTEFKGALTENYILQSLTAQFDSSFSYWTSDSIAEIDFLLQYRDKILPIEVKSGESIRSKSLAYYAKQYNPVLKIRYSLKNLEANADTLNIPIFLADHTKRFIDILLV
ncbi:MAG: ATP-binding protein [Saprospiraceae bacterium]|nr:ATP-binding protein [Saprospiraceae bacterium]